MTIIQDLTSEFSIQKWFAGNHTLNLASNSKQHFVLLSVTSHRDEPTSSHIKQFQVEVVHSSTRVNFLAQFSYMVMGFYYNLALH